MSKKKPQKKGSTSSKAATASGRGRESRKPAAELSEEQLESVAGGALNAYRTIEIHKKV